MAMKINGRNIVDGNVILATVGLDGCVNRFTSRRLPIGLLRQLGANSSIINEIRENDRRHTANRRSRRTTNHVINDINDTCFNNLRTFGIEIETFHNTNPNIAHDVCEKLNSLGINCIDQHRRDQYNHRDSSTAWRLVYDASICGEYPFELVSPILKGSAAFEQIVKVCAVLNELGCTVNKSCGLHVHHYAGDLNRNTLENCFYFYKRNEKLIDSIMPRSRHNGEYCLGLEHISLRDWDDSRYYKLNFCSLARHNTIEFRQHNGTTNATKIINWVKLTQLFLLKARRGSCSSLNELLTNIGFDNVEYYLSRAEDLAA